MGTLPWAWLDSKSEPLIGCVDVRASITRSRHSDNLLKTVASAQSDRHMAYLHLDGEWLHGDLCRDGSMAEYGYGVEGEIRLRYDKLSLGWA